MIAPNPAHDFLANGQLRLTELPAAQIVDRPAAEWAGAFTDFIGRFDEQPVCIGYGSKHLLVIVDDLFASLRVRRTQARFLRADLQCLWFQVLEDQRTAPSAKPSADVDLQSILVSDIDNVVQIL